MPRPSLLLPLALLAGCATHHATTTPLRPRFPTPLQPPTPQTVQALTGPTGFATYTRAPGDSLVTQLLLLKAGHYTLTLSGCNGLYRAQQGTWTLTADHLTLTPTETQGDPRFPLPHALTLRARSGRPVLVPDQTASQATSNGSDPNDLFVLTP